jgi:chemotaxis protein methyltransferase CheR
LRIWSAGCATGEEPYSVAILLEMLLPDLKEWDIVIIGTDINGESLKKGARGIYSPWSFRMLDKDIQGKYFKKHHDEWEIHENIKKMVHFQYGNLIEKGFFSQNPEICTMDLIICRNVFIYFEKAAVASVLNKFKRLLNPGGYLVTGHAELYGHDLVNLHQIAFPEAIIYQKTTEAGLQPAAIICLPRPVLKSVLPAPRLSKAKTSDPKKDSFDLVCLTAQAYANAGDYEKATDACQRAMNISAHSADPYLLLAHIAEARGNDEEAKIFFKKAIYLNPAFIAAYCELGGLYEKEHDIPRARKARTTAIEFLKYLPAQETVKPYDITAGEMLSYVESLTGATADAGVMAAGAGQASGR